MAYTNIWNENKLTGAEAANTIATLINSVRVDVQDRLQDIFQTPDFTVDPLRLYGLKFTDAQDSVINLGDNAGPSRSLIVKNKAANATYLTINSAGFTINVISGFGLAPIANNAVSVQGATSDNTSNIFLGKNSGGTTKFAVGSDGSGLFSATLSINTLSGVQPLAIIGITAFSRFSRNEAAFTGALMQFDRSGTVGGYIGMDSSDNLTIQRGADAGNAVTVVRASGLVILTGGLTVSAGTTTLQALNVAGQITNTQDGRQYLRTGASTGPQYFDIGNTTGRLFFGIEQAGGNALIASSIGYATVLTSAGATALQLGTNQVLAITISTAQVVTFSTSAIIGSDSGAQTGELLRIGGLNAAGFIGLSTYNSSTAANSFSGMRMYHLNGSSIIYQSGAVATEMISGGNGNESVNLSFYSKVAGVLARRGYFDINGVFTLANGLTVTAGGLTISAGTSLFSDGIRQAGANIARFENTFVGVPSGCTGVGVEIGVSGGQGNIQSFNRTGGTVVGTVFVGAITINNGLTIAATGLTITLGGLSVNSGGIVCTNGSITLGSGAGLTTNQNDLTIIGGSVDTLFRNSANNATNVSISDAGDLVALRGIINTVTGYRVGNSAATGNFLRGNGTNFVPATISTSDLPTLDTVRAYKSAASQTLSQNTLTAISFDAEDYDTNTMHDNVTNNTRLTAQTSGKYKITAHIGWTGVTSNVFIIIRKNGVATNLAETFLTVTSTSVGTTEVNCTLSLAAADYVEVYGQGDNVTPTILNNQERTYFEMQKLTA